MCFLYNILRISHLNDHLHINLETLLHFLLVREILENEMTQVSIDNFKDIKQLKILWVLKLIKWRESCETNLVTLRCPKNWNIMKTLQIDAVIVKAS